MPQMTADLNPAPGADRATPVATAAPPVPRRTSAWGWLVTVSASLILGVLVVGAVWWAASRQERVASYAVRGVVNGVTLDLGPASLDVVGAEEEQPLVVRRTERYSFGHRPLVTRDTTGGVLRIRARCPRSLLDSCRSAYRVSVPPNVPLTVRTTSGDVRFVDYRGSARIDSQSGSISVTAFCGFALLARATSGDVRAATSCSSERLDLRSRSGDVEALVPAGRYRVDASSDSGSARVDGVGTADDAPFEIQALSGSGDVRVQAAS